MSQIGSARALQTFCKPQTDPLSYTTVLTSYSVYMYSIYYCILATIDNDGNNNTCIVLLYCIVINRVYHH